MIKTNTIALIAMVLKSILPPIKLPSKKWLAFTVLISLPLPNLALPGDNQLPINIQSDRATQKTLEQGEKTEYFGNVVMTQGSLLIDADHIIIHSKDRKVTMITAEGQPATFQQRSNPKKQPIKAWANSINYLLLTETVVLTDEANIEQAGATVSGNRIEYNIASEQVKAEEKVNMVFVPASVQTNEAVNKTSDETKANNIDKDPNGRSGNQ